MAVRLETGRFDPGIRRKVGESLLEVSEGLMCKWSLNLGLGVKNQSSPGDC